MKIEQPPCQAIKNVPFRLIA